ncbi:MAG: Ppx/GppA phosphatase family protein [Lentimonas sp.]
MPSKETVAAIDIGSNSIKLLVARLGDGTERIETVFTETIETRISAGISREQPILNNEAIHAGTKTIAELLHRASSYNPTQTQLVATSAVRDALNGEKFINSTKSATGHSIRILSGSEEATTIGKGLACDPAIENTPEFIQMDIGGGSLELIRFSQGKIQQALSLQLGAVRLTERFIQDREIPVTASIERAIQEHVCTELVKSNFPFAPYSDRLIATGGAFSATRAVLAAEAGTTIENFRAQLTGNDISTLKSKLAAMPLHERILVPHLPASRADIVPTALITIETLLKHAQRDRLTHSFYNLRYGLVAKMLGL